MNQRVSRNNNDKNKIDFVSLATGGFVTRNTPNEQASVQVPPYKATGDVKAEEPKKGVAKASPNFKDIQPPAAPVSEADQKKIIAANTQVVKDKENTDKQ